MIGCLPLNICFSHTGRRNQEFKAVPKWRKYWRAIQKKDKPELLEKLTWERRYLQRLMIKFMRILETIPEIGDINVETVRLVTSRLLSNVIIMRKIQHKHFEDQFHFFFLSTV